MKPGRSMPPTVLISDALSPAAVQIFKDRGVAVDFQPNLGGDKEKLAELVGNFDGLAIRSATKVTSKMLEQAKNLKVIGRAGIGVDNVDIPAATAKGIIVMNTPFGNSEKNRFMGVEITGKTLGVIGCGNIGSIVADRGHGLRMKVIAYDPFLSPERARDLGVEKVELAELFRRADFITLHTPLTEKTKNIIDAKAIAEKLGSFAGQLTETGISKVQIAYEGAVAGMNTKALTAAAIAGLLRPMLQDVNVVSAPTVAKERGIVIEEVTREAAGDYESLITVTVVTTRQTRWVSGTVYADGRPRIVNIKGIRMDAEFGHSMIYITNLDKPGFIGKFSSTLGDAGINIATFHVGRDAPGGNAVALIEIDGELPPQVLTAVRALPQVQQAKPLRF